MPQLRFGTAGQRGGNLKTTYTKNMIEFDIYGNPQPPGLTEMDKKDFKTVFVDNFQNSQTRQSIYKKYNQFITDFQTEIVQEFKNWVNGSYTTRKENPNDIDIVSLVMYSDDLNTKYHLLKKFLTIGGSKEQYLVDGYVIQIYPEDDPRYKYTQEWINYWIKWFGMDRQGRPKGIIQLSFS
jgi:hypothetical protein